MASPLISVVIPAYNHARYIGEALDSVLRQGGVNLEVVVVDDGSTDGTWEYLASCRDPRLRVLRQDNRGAHYTINRCLSLAQGEYLAILNSDDRFHPQRLSRLLAASQEHGFGLVVSDIRLIDQQGELITDPGHWWVNWYAELKDHYRREGDAARALLGGNFAITTSNFFMHRALYQTLGAFRPFRYVLDYEYALRAACLPGNRLGFLLDEPLLDYRLHGANTILEHPLKANLETDFLLRRYVPKILGQETAPPLRHVSHIKRLILKLDRERHRRAHAEQLQQALRSAEALDGVNQQLSAANASLHEANQALHGANERLNQDNGTLNEVNRTLDAANRSLDAERLRLGDLLTRGYRDLADTQAALTRLEQSPSFRLGKALLTPARILKRFLSRPAVGGVRLKALDTDALRVRLAQVLSTVDVVSFDIFDTLLERAIEPPEHLHLVTCRTLARHLEVHYGIGKSLEELLACRADVEARLRRERQLRDGDHECKFSDMAAEMARVLRGAADAELTAWIIAEELRAEGEVLYVKPGMEAILAWLNGMGKRVIAISDMYLDEEHLQSLFERKGLQGHVDRVYVSSESGLGKYSGRLFRHVLEAERIQARQMLHVGDNRHSDSAAPSTLGIPSLWLDDKRNNRRRLILRGHAWLATRNPYWKGRHLLQIIDPPAPRNFHYDLGFSYLGPIYCTFILGVIEKVREHGLPRLFFLAREGELFHRLFRQLQGHWLEPEERPALTYLYVSRKSTAPAAMYKGLSHETTLAPLHNPNQRGLTSVCRTFDLPVEAFTEVAQRHGYGIDQRIDDWRSERYRDLIADPEFQAIVQRCAREQRDLLHAYLRQQGFFDHPRVGLVDIGWNGSSQRYFQDAFGDEGDYPKVFGLYMGWVQGIQHRLDPAKNITEGLLYDVRRGNGLEDGVTRFEELFEEGARALHATTLRYRREIDGWIVPVLKDDTAPDRQAELAMNPLIAEIQAGVLDFCQRFGRAVHLTGYTFAELRPFMMTLAERVITYPTRQEAQQLMQVTHSEDFGFDATMRLQQDHLTLKDVLHPRRFTNRLRRSNWIYGTGRMLGIPGLNMLLRYLDVTRTRP
ncbi:MAG: glycosyltransferase [Gammaproteobacteria bacterium]|nr:glycosyltransferase [Gammaproteobacteria bacterium]MCP5425755.1 glycosyltransferase [Gammaproteobacteria bacterium]MCP5458634.1 glycosyltransferase [Gammaproteobacteria bacterium]